MPTLHTTDENLNRGWGQPLPAELAGQWGVQRTGFSSIRLENAFEEVVQWHCLLPGIRLR